MNSLGKFMKGSQNYSHYHFEQEASNAKLDAKLQGVVVKDEISKTAQSLPVKLLIKYKMYQYVRKLAAEKMEICMFKVYRKELAYGMSKWSNSTKKSREFMENDAAYRITKWVLLQLAVRKRRKLKAKRLFGEQVAKDVELRGKDIYIEAIIVEAIITRVVATRTLQRVYRGFLGRMRARLVWVHKHRIKTQQKYDTREGLFRVYFEQHGAAIKLQRWAWKMGWPQRVRLRRRSYINHKRRKNKVLKIQRAWRGYVARKRVKVLQLQREAKRLEERRRRAIIAIQALIRGAVCRQRLKDMHRERQRVGARILQWMRLKEDASPTDWIAKDRQTKFGPASWSRGRRDGISFEHLKIGDEERIRLLGRRARQIQRVWVMYSARKRLRRLISIRKHIAARKLQHALKRYRNYRKMLWALSILQPFIRMKFRFLRRDDSSAFKIQRAWRYHIAHVHLRQRQGAVHTMFRFFRHVLHRKALLVRLHHRRRTAEAKTAGVVLFQESLEYTRIQEFWKGVDEGSNAPHELRNLFQLLSPKGLLEPGRWIKLMKSIPDLFDKSFTVKDVEILFVKLRKPPEKRLTYGQMIDLIYEMACLKYIHIASEKRRRKVGQGKGGLDSDLSKGRRPLSAVSRSSGYASEAVLRQRASIHNQQESLSTASSRGRSDESSAMGDEEEKVPVLDFKYGRLQGQAAVVTCFVDQYLAQTKAYRACVEPLQQHSSQSLADNIILQAVLRIEGFCRHRMMAKASWKEAVRLHEEYVQHRRSLAAVAIQRVYRGLIGRKWVVPRAQQMYVKCIDAEAGAPYWFNNVTENSFWEKPWLLREFDCGEAVLMPPREEMCVTDCQNDGCHRSATMYCGECDSVLCGTCSHQIHSEGRRRAHEVIHLTQCAQCGFQLATRHCRSCGDYYCDCCFKWVHRRGRMKFHVAGWVCDRCDACETRAGWLVLHDPAQDYKATVFCRICFTDMFGPGDPLEMDNVFAVQYLGPAVQDHLLKKRVQEEKRIAEVKFREMKAQELAKKRISSAITIQRIFRGHLARKNISSWVSERREVLEQRKTDDKVRNTLTHRFLTAVGLGKPLASDTSMEYAMKHFPWYMKGTVEDCVNKDWRLAATMAGFQQEVEKIGFVEGMGMLSHLWNVKAEVSRKKRKLLKLLAEKKFEHDAYVKIRASGTYVAIKARKEKLEQATKAVEAAEVALEKSEDKLDIAMERWVRYRDGPSGPLRKFVNDRRKNGIPLDISGRVVRGSRFLRIKRNQARLWEARTFPGCYIQLGGSTFEMVSGDMLYEAFAEANAIHELDIDSDDESEDDEDEEDNGNVDEINKDSSRNDQFDQQNPMIAASPDSGSRNKKKVKWRGSRLSEVGVEGDGSVAVTRLADEDGEGMVDDDGVRGASSSLDKDREMADEITVAMDRRWTLEDREDVPIFRIPIKPAHHALAFQISRRMMNSATAQYLVKKTVLGLHSLSQTTMMNSQMFDEESATAQTLRSLADSMARSRDKLLAKSNKPIRLPRNKKRRYTTLHTRLTRITDAIQKAVADMRNQMEHIKTIQSMPPFYRWEMSETKVQIECFLELDDGTNPKSLGQFFMDPDAPCDIMREYIERNFRLRLNETVGEDFCFHVKASNEILQRKLESRTWSKDFLTIKKAKNGEKEEETEDKFASYDARLKLPHVVTIIRDRALIGNGAPSMIPEFPPLDQEALLDDTA